MLEKKCRCGRVGKFNAAQAGRIAVCTDCGDRMFIPRPGASEPRLPYKKLRGDVTLTWEPNKDGASRESLIDQYAFLNGPALIGRDFHNRNHAYAVEVYLPIKGMGPQVIGYLEREVAELACDEMERGGRAMARVIQIGMRRNLFVRLEIEFYKE